MSKTDSLEKYLHQLARAKSLAKFQMRTIELQIRRIRSSEPEDEEFIFRWWADLQFLILALWRLRRAALIVKHEPFVDDAIKKFDLHLSGLKAMRDVGEHIEEYALNSPKRHRIDKTKAMLEVGAWDDPIYTWMDETLNVDEAYKYSAEIYIAIINAFDQCKEAWLADASEG